MTNVAKSIVMSSRSKLPRTIASTFLRKQIIQTLVRILSWFEKLMMACLDEGINISNKIVTRSL